MSSKTDPKLCLRCGRCLLVCPAFQLSLREDLSPRGKWMILNQCPENTQVFSLCLSCERCAQVCTQQLNFAQAKAEHLTKTSNFSLLNSGLNLALTSLGTKLAQFLANRPPYRPYFELRAREVPPLAPVVIFPGCLGRSFSHLEPILKSFLTTLGITVLDTPNWQCCGHPFVLAGKKDQGLEFQLVNQKIWEKLNQPLVVSFCSTCTKGLGQFLPQSKIMLADHLLNFVEIALLEPKASIFVHSSCHCQEDLSAIWPIPVLKNCCGAFAKTGQNLAKAVNTYFWEQIPGDSILFTNCLGCLIKLKLTGPKEVKVSHWLEHIAFKGR